MAHYSTHYRWAIIFLHGPLSFWLAMEILQEAAVPKLENGRAGPSSWTIAAAAGGGGGGHLLEMLENISLPLLFSQPPEHRGLSSLIQLSLDQPHGSRETGGWHVPWGEHISEANPFQDLLLYHACHPCYPSSWRKSPASVFLTLTSRASQKPSTGPSGYMT